MQNPTRRQTLALGLGASGALLCPPLYSRSRRRQSIAELALAFREVPHEAVFDVAAQVLRAGVSREVFLGAVFRAGVEEVRPRPHGILHCVMEVESNFQLAGAATPAQAWLPALWNLDDFKVSQARDLAEDGDWKLAARPEVERTDEPAARAEFLAAMEAWDPDRAELALLALLPHHDHASLCELLWPLALRCYAFIGHKPIYVVQVERALRRIGWEQSEPALRSLVRTVLVERETTDFEHARALIAELEVEWPDDAAGDEPDPGASEALLRELRVASPADAQAIVLEGLLAGLAPDSIWDGIRLHGAEVFLRRPGRQATAGRGALLPVHAVTLPNALGHIYRTTRSNETRRLALLQAAAWTVRMRVDLGNMVGLTSDGPGIEQLSTGAPAPQELDDLLQAPSASGACALLREQPGLTNAYATALRRSLFRHGIEHHQHKYAAACIEDAGLVHPRWSAHLLGAGIEYLATPDEPETEVYQRSRACLRKAGVL